MGSVEQLHVSDIVTELSSTNLFNPFSYYLATPEHFAAHQHLYRASAIPPAVGVPLKAPLCLTCSPREVDIVRMTQAAAKAHEPWEGSSSSSSSINNYEELDESTSSAKQQPEGVDEDANVGDSDFEPKACQYFSIVFAPNNNEYALVDCLGPDIPTSWIYKFNPKSEAEPIMPVYLLQNNTLLKANVAKIALPQVRTFPVMISGGYHAQARMYLPPGLREDEITKYPMVVHVYSSPGTQLVTEKWRIDWNTYLVGAKDYIITEIDGRGSSGQGYQLLHEVYRRLGTVEVSDQLEVSDYLRDSLHFVDSKRMGVWG